MHSRSISGLIRGLIIVGTFALASCSNGGANSQQTIRMGDYSFDMPDTLDGPTVDIEVINDGAFIHELGLSQIKPGTTVDQILEHLNSETNSAADFVIGDPGGISLIGPDESLRYQRHLQVGSYVVFCPMTFADGSEHYDAGMIRLFTVADARDETLPVADATITLADGSIVVPTLVAGKRSYAITNTGTVPHEVSIAGVLTKNNLDFAAIGDQGGAWIQGGQVGPPPFDVHFPGGQQRIPPGETVVLTMTLRPAYLYQFGDFAGDPPIIAYGSTS